MPTRSLLSGLAVAGVFFVAVASLSLPLRAKAADAPSGGRTEKLADPLPLGTRLTPAQLIASNGKPQRLVFQSSSGLTALCFLPLRKGLCGPIAEQLPQLQALQKQWKDAGLRVVVVSDVEPRQMEATRKRFGFQLPLYYDPAGAFTKSCRVRSAFETFFVDGRGELAFRQSAPFQLSGSPLTRFLQQMLQPANRPSARQAIGKGGGHV